MRRLNIGLIGFGVVGEGIYQVLSQKTQLNAKIKRIVIKDSLKKRNAPAELFTTLADDVINDPGVELVVELINDVEMAFHIVRAAMKRGKSVISANKRMIAQHHVDLIRLSERYGVTLLYEGAVGGGIPIVRNLEDHFGNDKLTHVRGIVNGSTNYILSRMVQENVNYPRALEEAQTKGFAEHDPSYDVEGIDTACKLSILTLHAFGKVVAPHLILRKGITALHPLDFQYAKRRKQVIKLIASCKAYRLGDVVELSVLPTFISKESTLGTTNEEFNSLGFGSTLAEEQYFCGKGAGRYPTSLAVMNDICAYRNGYKYPFAKGTNTAANSFLSSGKFYCSYEFDTPMDFSIFESIDERCMGQNRGYVVGNLSYEKLHSSGILDNRDISVIDCS